MHASINWNLDSVFDGGIEGPLFQETLQAIEESIQSLNERVQSLDALHADPGSWATLLMEFEALEELQRRLEQSCDSKFAAESIFI